jgi:hypothetical protein
MVKGAQSEEARDDLKEQTTENDEAEDSYTSDAPR